MTGLSDLRDLDEVADGKRTIGQLCGALGQSSEHLPSAGGRNELFENLAVLDLPICGSVNAPRLPDPLQPFEDESMLGLICRYAGEIGMEVSRKVLAPIDLDHLSHLRMANRTHDAETSEALRILLGLDGKVFARLCPWTASEHERSVLGCPLPSRLVTFMSRHFCPKCLEEAPYHRAIWDLTVLPGCPRHGTALRATCEQCGQPPSWNRMWPHLCSRSTCNAELSCQTPGDKFDAAGVDACRQVEALICDGVPGASAPLDVGATLQAAVILGSSALGKRLGAHQEDMRHHPAWLAAAMAVGLEALRDWPVNFHAYLDERRRQSASRKGRHGASKTLGPVAGRLGLLRGTPTGDVLCPAMDAWFAKQADLTTRIPQVGAIRAEGVMPVLSVPQAARRFGTGTANFRGIAQQHGLFKLAPNGSGAMALIDTHALDRLIAEREEQTDRKGACAILSVNRINLRHLVNADLVQVIPENERICPELAFSRPWLQTFLAELEAKASSPDKPPGSRPTRLTAIGMPGGTVELIRSVVDGSLKPVGLDKAATGFERLVFATEQKVLPRQDVADGFVSPGDVGTLLGIDPSSLSEMITARLFGPPSEGKGRRRVVSTKGLAAFRRDYILTPEIAARSGLPWQGMVTRLAKVGIRPVSGHGVDGLRRHVFRRDEVERELGRLCPRM